MFYEEYSFLGYIVQGNFVCGGNVSPPCSGAKNKPSKKPAEADTKLNFFI
jgi:hypothetical protein